MVNFESFRGGSGRRQSPLTHWPRWRGRFAGWRLGLLLLGAYPAGVILTSGPHCTTPPDAATHSTDHLGHGAHPSGRETPDRCRCPGPDCCPSLAVQFGPDGGAISLPGSPPIILACPAGPAFRPAPFLLPFAIGPPRPSDMSL